jgi:hypothetical protein
MFHESRNYHANGTCGVDGASEPEAPEPPVSLPAGPGDVRLLEHDSLPPRHAHRDAGEEGAGRLNHGSFGGMIGNAGVERLFACGEMRSGTSARNRVSRSVRLAVIAPRRVCRFPSADDISNRIDQKQYSTPGGSAGS